MNSIERYTTQDPVTTNNGTIWPPREIKTVRGDLALASVNFGHESSSRDAMIVAHSAKSVVVCGTNPITEESNRVRSSVIILTTQKQDDPDGEYLMHLENSAANVISNSTGLRDIDKRQGERAHKYQTSGRKGTGSMVILENNRDNCDGDFAEQLNHTALIIQSAKTLRTISLDFNYHGFYPNGLGNIEPTTPKLNQGDVHRVVLMSSGMQTALHLQEDMHYLHLYRENDLSEDMTEALDTLRDQPPSHLARWLVNRAQSALIVGPKIRSRRNLPYTNPKPSLSVAVWDTNTIV